ncbi:uncharacterized protein E5676_scaffold544G00010 [Cucumis melo var. makuwa]|uniref:Transposase Tnp1/En/Spm-like domain-containing protein n=1 Tax=Cucumis melo var. makuwa TaxID=1194695 RepID=A0A5D3CB10_CUCMM|nr:uncharacterized protein E5676_scaffold544G00010 [Cucumis melo var. makuwa]
MVDSQDVATAKEKGESSTQKRKRGPTEMKEITRARRTTLRFHVPITYSDWPIVPKEIKDKIFELIEVGFVVDPRSKKTIIQNAGVCFHVEGDNVKVVVDVVVDGDCAIPIPSEQGMYKMSQEVGSHILWPVDLIITNNIKMDYGEFTKDMSTFAPTPIQNAPVALWFLLRMVEHMGYLYTRMESSRTLNLYKFVDAGSINCGSSKEERVQLLTARLLETDYDQLLLIPYNFGSFNIMNKKKSNWRVVKQSGVVECGYYVMRFMCDIIMSTSTSIIQIMKDSPRAYTRDNIDCIWFEWAEFVGKHVHCS